MMSILQAPQWGFVESSQHSPLSGCESPACDLDFATESVDLDLQLDPISHPLSVRAPPAKSNASPNKRSANGGRVANAARQQKSDIQPIAKKTLIQIPGLPPLVHCSRVRPDKIDFALSFRKRLDQVAYDQRRNNKVSLQKLYEEWILLLRQPPLLTYSECLFAMYLCGVIKVHKNGDVTYKTLSTSPEIVANNFAKVVPLDQHVELTNILCRAIEKLRSKGQLTTLANIRQQISEFLGTKKLSDADWRNLTNVLNWSDDFRHHNIMLDGSSTVVHFIVGLQNETTSSFDGPSSLQTERNTQPGDNAFSYPLSTLQSEVVEPLETFAPMVAPMVTPTQDPFCGAQAVSYPQELPYGSIGTHQIPNTFLPTNIAVESRVASTLPKLSVRDYSPAPVNPYPSFESHTLPHENEPNILFTSSEIQQRCLQSHRPSPLHRMKQQARPHVDLLADQFAPVDVLNQMSSFVDSIDHPDDISYSSMEHLAPAFADEGHYPISSISPRSASSGSPLQSPASTFTQSRGFHDSFMNQPAHHLWYGAPPTSTLATRLTRGNPSPSLWADLHASSHLAQPETQNYPISSLFSLPSIF